VYTAKGGESIAANDVPQRGRWGGAGQRQLAFVVRTGARTRSNFRSFIYRDRH